MCRTSNCAHSQRRMHASQAAVQRPKVETVPMPSGMDTSCAHFLRLNETERRITCKVRLSSMPMSATRIEEETYYCNIGYMCSVHCIIIKGHPPDASYLLVWLCRWSNFRYLTWTTSLLASAYWTAFRLSDCTGVKYLWSADQVKTRYLGCGKTYRAAKLAHTVAAGQGR